jgi:hypothetical protein
MNPDRLDELLTNSAPMTQPAPRAAVEEMIVASRQRASRRGRAPRIVAAATLAALLVGGAGVATATDGFRWAPWAQDPVGAVKIAMQDGRQCELRFSEYRAGNPFFLGEVNAILRDWYRSTDVVAEARAVLPTMLQRVGPVDLAPGETLGSLPEGEAERRAWSREWLAWDLAVSEVESRELSRHGIAPGDGRFDGSERSSQIRCDGVDELLSSNGAGS